tara:strand:- start:3803 stop:4339 length:537 start_codon:yes stop_codon:yes gene_type:complete
MTEASNQKQSQDNLHLGICESGKILHIAGRFDEALEKYRNAMMMSASQRAPQVFARHYVDCILDCLQHAKRFDVAIELLDQAISNKGGESPVVIAPFQFRKLIILCQLGQHQEALILVSELDSTMYADSALYLALKQALVRRQSMPERWLDQILNHHKFYTVRKDNVDKKRAQIGQKH